MPCNQWVWPRVIVGNRSAEEVAVRKQSESRHVILDRVQHVKVVIAWVTRRLARV